MRNTVLSLGIAALALLSAPAFADTVLSTADYSSDEPGDFSISGTEFVAASFQITQQTQLTAIGGHFSQFSDGDNIFGAIVSASSLSTSPSLANILGYTTFAPDGSDQLASLSLNLAPGTYDVIFGSGLFGAVGGSGLATGQTSGIASVSATTLFQSLDGGSSWSLLGENDVRLVVQGTPVAPVPLPAALPLLASGLAGIGAMVRRRRSKV